MLLWLRREDLDKYCGYLRFFVSEERRHTLEIGVSLGLPGRRVPGLIVLLSVLNDTVWMAIRQHSIQPSDIVVIQFQIPKQ
jgi:hypothetical protein